MLLFRAGSEQKHGRAARSGRAAGGYSARQDRDLVRFAGHAVPRQADAAGGAVGQPRTPRSRASPLLVFNDGDRSMGLMVDEIIDVVEDRLNIELSGARPGLLGTAVIAGHATDVIDTGYWLTQAWQDWFHGAAQSADRNTARHVLVVEDSDFFRQLADADPRRRGLPRHRRAKCGRGACACAKPARCSTRSCRTSRCRTWTGSTSRARCAPAVLGRDCR